MRQKTRKIKSINGLFQRVTVNRFLMDFEDILLENTTDEVDTEHSEHFFPRLSSLQFSRQEMTQQQNSSQTTGCCHLI